MSATAAAASTTIARLACRYAVAAADPEASAVRARLEAVLDRRLPAALADALAPLDRADPGAVWIVRRMRADARVSATSDDLDLLARQWGSQLAAAIVATLRRGPGGDVVRFGSRAEYLAAYAAARSQDGGDSWVFASLSHLHVLAPATALRTGAAGAGVRVTDVVVELAMLHRLEPLLAVSGEAALRLLWEACLADAPPRPPADPGLEHVAEVAARLGAAPRGEPAAERALRLFATAVLELGADGVAAPAVDALVRAGGEVATGDAAIGPRRAQPRPAHDAPRVDGRSPPPAAAGPPDADAQPPARLASDGEVFAADGAPAFLVLPSLAAVGLGDVPAGARARVLCRLLGCCLDLAVLLAAGAPPDAPMDSSSDAEQLLGALLSALDADDRIDGRWAVADEVAHPDGERTVALLRDAVSGTWLAGALVADGHAPPWAALAERVEVALGRSVDVVAAGGDVRDATGLDRALARMRPAGADVAWLAPEDDGDLAAGIAARAALHHLTRRLLGFHRATMAYAVERFLPAGGVVAVAPARIHAELAPAPLAVVLTMVGLDAFDYRVAWLEREVAVSHRTG